MGEYDRAETLLRNTSQKQDNYWPAHMELANLLLVTGRTGEAIETWQQSNLYKRGKYE
jgi:hypothetical protein